MGILILRFILSRVLFIWLVKYRMNTVGTNLLFGPKTGGISQIKCTFAEILHYLWCNFRACSLHKHFVINMFLDYIPKTIDFTQVL